MSLNIKSLALVLTIIVACALPVVAQDAPSPTAVLMGTVPLFTVSRAPLALGDRLWANMGDDGECTYASLAKGGGYAPLMERSCFDLAGKGYRPRVTPSTTNYFQAEVVGIRRLDGVWHYEIEYRPKGRPSTSARVPFDRVYAIQNPLPEVASIAIVLAAVNW